jgi:hypothetical protein
MSGMAICVVGALVLGWAEIANIATGNGNGPAARSTFFAAGWTVIAVVLAHSRWPALFLLAVAGVVAGALVLGAAGEVEIVAVAAAVSAALTLGWIERSRRHWTAESRRGIALVLLSLLAGAAAAGVVVLQAQKDPRQPALVAQGREDARIKPAWSDPLASASSTRADKAARHTPRHTANPAAKPVSRSHPAPARSHTSVWVYVVAAILLLVLVLAALMVARLLSTRLAWHRLQCRLAAGPPAEQVTGAWAWTRIRLEACRLPLPVDVSPDRVVAGGSIDDVPANVFAPLRTLAAAATAAAFSSRPSPGADEVAAAWAAAGQADESARELLTRTGRARLALRGPASTVRSS